MGWPRERSNQGGRLTTYYKRTRLSMQNNEASGSSEAETTERAGTAEEVIGLGALKETYECDRFVDAVRGG